MIRRFVCLCLLSYLSSVDPVLGSIFCKDSVIDAITYVRTIGDGMWLIISEGHYWWISQKQFPPSDDSAEKLPEPFKKPTAALYMDTTQCPSTRSKGIRISEQQIWVIEMIGNRLMMTSFDVAYNKWVPPSSDQSVPAVPIAGDPCLGYARINDSAPIDAMFPINQFEVYLVQDSKYSMVDCSPICTPGKYGTGNNPKDISDWATTGKITGMVSYSDKEMYIFQNDLYYKLTIKGNPKDGQIKGTKDPGSKVMSELLKVNMSGECTKVTKVPDVTTVSGEPQSIATNLNPGVTDDRGTKEVPQLSEGGLSTTLLIVIIVVVIILLGCAAVVFGIYALRKPNKKGDAEEQQQGMTPSTKSITKFDSKVTSTADPSSKTSNVSKTAKSKLNQNKEVKSARSALPTSAVKSTATKTTLDSKK